MLSTDRKCQISDRKPQNKTDIIFGTSFAAADAKQPTKQSEEETAARRRINNSRQQPAQTEDPVVERS